MTLNRKGYMLVEIVVSFVIAMSIAFYLMNLTYQFKNTNEDIYQSITYMNDKTVITKNIMNDLDRGIVLEVPKESSLGQNVEISFRMKVKATNEEEKRKIQISTQDGITTIYYGKVDSSDHYVTTDVSYYKKQLQKSLLVDSNNIKTNSRGDYLSIEIPIHSLYESKNYNIKLFVQKEWITIPLRNVRVGGYVSLTPTKSSATASKNQTGYTENQTFHPQELNLWRVISKNDDGTVEIISEHVSSDNIYFSGRKGYQNFVGYLNVLASQYENSAYTIASRHFGYGGQTENIINTSMFTNPAPWTCNTGDSCYPEDDEDLGGGDTWYEWDYYLVNDALHTIVATNLDGTATAYWMASRYYGYESSTNYRWYGRRVQDTGGFGHNSLYRYGNNKFTDRPYANALRPILTLKSGLKVGGDGTKESPYQLS